METPKHPGRNLFVNIPVKDLDQSIAFYTELGFTFNPLFSDENGTCMLVGEQAFFMLLKKERFDEFAKDRGITDLEFRPAGGFAFSVESREEVDGIMERAVANGGIDVDDTQDLGFMYSRGFDDPSGHRFDVMWMDPAAVEAGPETHATETANA